MDVNITNGGHWGANFDPNDVMEAQWGTGTFVAVDCGLISMSLSPNEAYQALGYTGIAYDMVRLTIPALPCPAI